jgi:hypothetical protein
MVPYSIPYASAAFRANPEVDCDPQTNSHSDSDSDVIRYRAYGRAQDDPNDEATHSLQFHDQSSDLELGVAGVRKNQGNHTIDVGNYLIPPSCNLATRRPVPARR